MISTLYMSALDKVVKMRKQGIPVADLCLLFNKESHTCHSRSYTIYEVIKACLSSSTPSCLPVCGTDGCSACSAQLRFSQYTCLMCAVVFPPSQSLGASAGVSTLPRCPGNSATDFEVLAPPPPPPPIRSIIFQAPDATTPLC